MSQRPFSSLLCVLLLAACSEERAPSAAATAPGCEPDRARFEGEIRPRLERYCGSCHGVTPQFGAPDSLLDLEELMASSNGGRLVDRVARRLADGTMPPAGMPRLPEADADAIASWASCGQVDVMPSGGLVSSAPPFLSAAVAPAGLETLDLTADQHPVGPEVRDEYACFVVDLPIASERFIRRFEMVFGDTRVLHHAILSRDSQRRTEPGYFPCNGGGGLPPGSEYLYTWAPGQSAIELPGGGLRARPGDRFILQIHYNNGSGLEGVVDSSGVRLFLGPPEGTEYGMMSFGPSVFKLPARTRTTIGGTCKVRSAVRLLAGMPHMHRLGSSFAQTLRRGDSVSDMISLSGWDFGSQLFYQLPFELHEGDEVRTECTYANTTDEVVQFGEKTSDEMCSNFVYVTPPPEQLSCDEGSPDRPTDVAYQPGACAAPGAPSPGLVRGSWEQVTQPPSFAAGPVADGRWELVGMTMYSTGGDTPVGSLDFAASYTLARGQVFLAASALTFDLDTDPVIILGDGVRFGSPASESFTVPFDGASPVEAQESCPAPGSKRAFAWGLDGEELVLTFTRSDVPGMKLWPSYRFRRVSPPGG